MPRYVSAKREVLRYVERHGSVDSLEVATALGYATRAGAAAPLLRLHRHGHLHRQRTTPRAYVYALSSKGAGWPSCVVICAVYARKSTDERDKAPDARSCERQIDQARTYALRKGCAIADTHVYADEAVSGAEFDRPGLRRLLAATDGRPPFDVLIVSEQSRLGRSPSAGRRRAYAKCCTGLFTAGSSCGTGRRSAIAGERRSSRAVPRLRGSAARRPSSASSPRSSGAPPTSASTVSARRICAALTAACGAVQGPASSQRTS